MTGLVRVPGSYASNFDTGTGTTVVDLINVGNGTQGHAKIVALDVIFTKSMPGKRFGF